MLLQDPTPCIKVMNPQSGMTGDPGFKHNLESTTNSGKIYISTPGRMWMGLQECLQTSPILLMILSVFVVLRGTVL